MKVPVRRMIGIVTSGIPASMIHNILYDIIKIAGGIIVYQWFRGIL